MKVKQLNDALPSMPVEILGMNGTQHMQEQNLQLLKMKNEAKKMIEFKKMII